MEQVFGYIISLGASVMMPIIFTIIGLCIGMKFGKALKSGLFVGVGFVGLGVVTALLTTNFNDPLKGISDIYHLQLNVFDMGWPAAAAVAYNTAVGALTMHCAAFFAELAVGDRFKVTRYTPKTAAQICKMKVSATEYDKESSLVVISCNDVNARRAEDILNEIFEAYKRDVVDNKNRVAQNTADFVEGRIALIGEELSRVENQLVNFKKQNGIINFTQSTQTFTTESAAARKLTLDLATQLSIAEYLADYVNKHANSHELIPSLNLSGGDFNSQITAYNALMNERNRLAENSSESQSVVREHDRQLAEMRTAISASLRSYVQTVKMQLSDARGNENMLSGNMAGVPEKEKQGLDIQRQQSLKEALYTYLLNKREEVAMQLAINEANVRLVEAPLGAAAPVSPRSGIIMLISLIIGIAIPAMVLWLRTLLDITVSGRKVPVEIGKTIWKTLHIAGSGGTTNWFPRTIRFLSKIKYADEHIRRKEGKTGAKKK